MTGTNLKVVRLETGVAKGYTVREALVAASRKAKEIDAQSICIVMRSADNAVHTRSAGCDWIERRGMLDIAKEDS